MSYTPITQAEVLYQAPITTQLFVKTRNNLDHIKSAITDGASALQGVNTSTITTSGKVRIGNNLYVHGGDVNGPTQQFNLAGDEKFNEDVSSNGYLTCSAGCNFSDTETDGTDWNAVTLSIMFGKTNTWIEMGCF